MTSSNGSPQASLDSLIADFNDHPELHGEVYKLAYHCRFLKRYEDARRLYQCLLDTWPESEYVILSRGGVIMADIGLGNDANAQAALDKLIADFNDHPGLPGAVFVVGEQYYNEAFWCENDGLAAEAKECFRKAIAVWERIITELPESTITAQAYYFSARCYERIDECEKAIPYYQVVVDSWPDYQYADYAHFLLARCYKKLERAGRISRAEAVVKIQQACEKLLANYPSSKVVKAVHGLLKQLDLMNLR